MSLDFPRTTSPTQTSENKSSDASLAARNRRHHRSLRHPCLRSPVVRGYTGNALKGAIIPIKATEVITVTHTQERIDLLAQGEATQQPASTMRGREGGVCVFVCVYLSSGFKGQCFNYAIPIAKSYPPMTSLPYLGLVVLPLRTPRGDLARRVSN